MVLSIDRHAFDALLDAAKARAKARTDADLPADALERARRRAEGGGAGARPGGRSRRIPLEQLRLAINAVFDSWWAKKAVDYRRINRLSDDWGTAVTVMAMVFGNLGATSGTGVCFSRDPSSGERRFFGEYLINAQGEDVVAGIRTPEPIDALKQKMPKVYASSSAIKELETHYQRDAGHRVHGAGRHALHAADALRQADRRGRGAHRGARWPRERLIDRDDRAASGSSRSALHQLLRPDLDPKAKYTVVAKGIAASPGGRGRQGGASSRDGGRDGPAGRARSSSSARRRRPRTWPACTWPRAS